MTRTTLIAAAVIVASLVAALVLIPPDSQVRRPRPPGGTDWPMRNEPPASRLDAAAVSATELEIASMFEKCGTQYVTRFTEWHPLGGNVATPVTRMERYLQVSLTAERQPLSDVDGLNHIDWRGAVRMDARAWASTEGGAPGEWRTFEGRRLDVRRKSGRWEVASPWLEHLRNKRARREGCGGVTAPPPNR